MRLIIDAPRASSRSSPQALLEHEVLERAEIDGIMEGVPRIDRRRGAAVAASRRCGRVASRPDARASPTAGP